MAPKEKPPYKFITEKDYDGIVNNPQDCTVVRISFYNKPLQEEFDGILYIEVENQKSLAEIEDILESIRKTSFPKSVSYKEDIRRPKAKDVIDSKTSA